MRKTTAGNLKVGLLVTAGFLFFTAKNLAHATNDLPSARAFFLMNARTGEIIGQKNPDDAFPPASTTKVMTAILALESGRLDQRIPIPREATRVQPSRINLRVGESVVLRDLVYSLLLNSANDSAIAVAVALGGSVERFAKMMTDKAIAIGARNTSFRNPHGLTEKGHYSTARDLALIFQYALSRPLFREIAQQREWSISTVGKRPRTIRLRSHNRLLWEFDGVALGKTGYTIAAQRCYVGSVSRDGTELIVSMLGSKRLWADTKKLLELGFDEDHDIFTTPVVLRANAASTTPLNLEVSQPTESRRQRYSLQLASFHDREKADSLTEEILQKGYQARVYKVHQEAGQPWYRVRIGSYATIAQAKEAMVRFTQMLGHSAVVVRAW